ncbi:MAG: hypothetical protein AAFV53_04145 [Myxococcota bacterium]
MSRARKGHIFTLLFLTACDRTPAPSIDDGLAYGQALVAVSARPEDAASICAPLLDAALRGDCLTAAAEALARDDAPIAQALCEQIDVGLQADECWFMVAERASLPTLCDRAGRFQEDCRLHLLQQRVYTANLPQDAPSLLKTLGFLPDDEKAWTLMYRQILSRERPLDVSLCAAEPAGRQRWCRRSGEGLLHDRLNYARDAGQLKRWCVDGGDLPMSVRYVAHPELDAAFNRRTDLCPSR